MKPTNPVASFLSQEVLGLKEVMKGVGRFLKGGASKPVLEELAIASTEEELTALHRRFVRPMFEHLKKGESFPSAGWDDLEPSFYEVFEQGLFLEEQEILSLTRFLQESVLVRRKLGASTQDLGMDLYFWALGLADLSVLADHLHSFIDEAGELKESAVPEMKQLRSAIRQARTDLMKQARAVVRENPTFFQEEDVIERDGRVLVPLKANFKGRVQGLIHSLSGTGSTLFLEPFALVERNNEKQGLEDEYRQIRFRVLRELSARIRAERLAIEALWSEMAIFDTWRARALYGLALDGNYPETAEMTLSILEARHPLIVDPVPLNLALPEDKHALIITGPNAGGKTVSLKTIGLFSLMNQLGIPLPLSEHSKLPIFDQIFVDIGDAQSISASLSTFSAHMEKVAELQAKATDNSLILLDELGSSTDPEQGLALAQALLEDLIGRRALVVVSTHFSYLKYLGYTKEGAINASLNIDEETLMPTYQIRMGVPGESFAFALARRRGLAEDVLTRAEGLYKSKETEGRAFMEKLRLREKELSEKTESLDRELVSLSIRLKKTETRETELKEREEELLEREVREESSFVSEARRELEQLQQQLAHSAGIKEPWKKSKDHIKKWEEELSAKKKAKEALAEANKIEIPLEEGMQVRLRRQGTIGVLLRPEKRDSWQVQVGSFKLVVPARDLESFVEKVNARKEALSKPKYYEGGTTELEGNAQFSLDIRGMRLEEALKSLQAQLDRALVQGLLKFSIIHGMGNGVLGDGVHRVLGAHPHVAKFYFANAGEGGTGKTWVELKT